MVKSRKFKQEQILTELGEETTHADLLQTMERLEQYRVTPPSDQDTADLFALLKPLLPETTGDAYGPVKEAPTSEWNRLLNVLQLVRPQLMLLSKWFVLASILFLLAGLVLANKAHGNAFKFLTNAAPLLGILTVFFEFRAKLSGMDELETACPYSPAQLATARLIVALGYDILLCLAVTPMVSFWQGRLLWQVMLSWFAPLLMMLGVALAVSLHLRIINGCLVATAFWVLQLAASEGKIAVLAPLLDRPVLVVDLIRLGVGGLLLIYTYLRWNVLVGRMNNNFGD
jgi:hypothetical protein